MREEKKRWKISFDCHSGTLLCAVHYSVSTCMWIWMDHEKTSNFYSPISWDPILIVLGAFRVYWILLILLLAIVCMDFCGNDNAISIAYHILFIATNFVPNSICIRFFAYQTSKQALYLYVCTNIDKSKLTQNANFKQWISAFYFLGNCTHIFIEWWHDKSIILANFVFRSSLSFAVPFPDFGSNRSFFFLLWRRIQHVSRTETFDKTLVLCICGIPTLSIYQSLYIFTISHGGFIRGPISISMNCHVILKTWKQYMEEILYIRNQDGRGASVCPIFSEMHLIMARFHSFRLESPTQFI